MLVTHARRAAGLATFGGAGRHTTMGRMMRSCYVALALVACRAPEPVPGPGSAATPAHASAPAPARPVAPAAPEEVAFKPLPPAPAIPSHAQIADAIAAGFPAAARARAREALATVVLPWDLRGLSTDDQPPRLIEVAYGDLIGVLGRHAPEARLASLEGLVCESQSGRVLDVAMSLGVARWMLERPGRSPSGPWIDRAAPFVRQGRAAVIAEAEQRITELEALEQHPDEACRERMRLDLVHARFALTSARKGNFGLSSGPFASFLRGVGEPTRDFKIH